MSFLNFHTNSYISATVHHTNPYITLGSPVMTQDSLHVLSLIISQSFVALWLLLGVEDTFGIEQEKIKGQKNRQNNENDRLARRCSIVMCPVLTSSTPRSLRE